MYVTEYIFDSLSIDNIQKFYNVLLAIDKIKKVDYDLKNKSVKIFTEKKELIDESLLINSGKLVNASFRCKSKNTVKIK